jgi:transitional endoplasmic reticulum ATPase
MADIFEQRGGGTASDAMIASVSDSTMDNCARSPIRVRVAEALEGDIDRGVIRLNPADMTHLGAVPGAVVAIKGKRMTVAKAMPASMETARRRAIRMDGIIRDNAGAGLDDWVKVEGVAAAAARELVLAPLDPGSYGPDEVRRLREALAGLAVIKRDKIKVSIFSARGTFFLVISTEPEGPVVLTGATDVRIQTVTATKEKLYHVRYEDVGGLEEAVLRVRELVELPIKYREVLAELRIEAPKGILLYGPPGTGKTLIARAVASEVDAHFIRVDGPEIIHRFYGESEARLREIFEQAQRRAPSIIFLDELDAIAPKRSEVTGEVEKRVVAQLLALMDGLAPRGQVVVIGATNLPEALDPALRRPGRFDREIVIPVPNRTARHKILQIHTRGMPLAADVDLERLAEITHGFVGADLQALSKEAGMRALHEILDKADTDTASPLELARRARVHMRHFVAALKDIEPTATREFFAERPNVHWEDIGGLVKQRTTLESLVQLPHEHPELFQQAGIHPPKGVLFSGPPGTGKTLLAKALATETGLSFITVDAAAIFSKWLGESEKVIRQVFKKARQAAPCLLLFDELDAIVPRRGGGAYTGNTDRIVNQFLSEMDAFDEFTEVMVLGATNRLDLVDPALLNPGRFGLILEFPLPDEAARAQIFRVHTRHMPLAPDIDFSALAGKSAGLSGADIAAVCRQAALEQIRLLIGAKGHGQVEALCITQRDLLTALEQWVGNEKGEAGDGLRDL